MAASDRGKAGRDAETPPKKRARSTGAAPKKPAKRVSATAKKSPTAAAKKPAKAASAAAKAASATRRSAKPASATAKTASAAGVSPTSREEAEPTTADPATTDLPLPPAKQTVVTDTARGYFEALAARDAAAAARAWAQDGVDDMVPIGIFRGPAAIQGLFEEMFTAMPDCRFTVERITADDQVAAVQWRVVGTFSAGSFQGLEPNGRRVELRGTDCLEIQDGKIVHNTGVFDGAAFARQVGLLPAEDSGADRAIRAGYNTVTRLRRTISRRSAR